MGRISTYEVEGYLILHSGHPVHTGDEAVERNKWVGIILDPGMARLWKDGGEIRINYGNQ